MEQAKSNGRSHLFTIRVWEEEVEVDITEWRGKVQLLPGGEAHYFRGWATLAPLLLAMLSQLDTDTGEQQEHEKLL